MGSRIDAAAERLDRFITAERLRLYPTAILIGQIVMVIAMIGIPLIASSEDQTLLPDFAAPWTGASFFLDGRLSELYDVKAQWAFQTEAVRNAAPSWFVSPPHVALLYTPLALVSFNTAALIWTAFSILCIAVSVRLLEPFAPTMFREHRVVTILMVVSSFPIFELLGAGQQSALTLLLMVGGIRLILADQQGWAGIVFALGAIKPQLFILVPFVLLAMRMWKALATGALTGLATLAITHVVFGPEVFRAWLEALTSPAYAELVQIDQAWKMIGLPAFFVTLAPPVWAPAVASIGIFLTLAVVAFSVPKIFAWAHRGVDQRAIWSLALLATILASPHLVLYDLTLIFVPALYLVEVANTRATRVSLLLLYFLTWITAVLHVVAANLTWPLTLIDASWATLTIIIMWRELDRQFRGEPRKMRPAS